MELLAWWKPSFVLIKAVLLRNKRFSDPRPQVTENKSSLLGEVKKPSYEILRTEAEGLRCLWCQLCPHISPLSFECPSLPTCPEPAQRFPCSSCCTELDHFPARSSTVDLWARRRNKMYPCNIKIQSLILKERKESFHEEAESSFQILFWNNWPGHCVHPVVIGSRAAGVLGHVLLVGVTDVTVFNFNRQRLCSQKWGCSERSLLFWGVLGLWRNPYWLGMKNLE